MNWTSIRKRLAHWYDAGHRDLPWRRTRDPYAIWISEIMLQQTRVAAVIPYYERFLARFPTPQILAEAPEEEVLAFWSGLGYYSRARNLQKAARQIAGTFPSTYQTIRELAGVGDYTAAAVASIAFGLPHAVVDGNVRRVAMRLTNDAQADTQGVANELLDRANPSRSNQALMELGATICTPRDPACATCPVASLCLARKAGTVSELPPSKMKQAPVKKDRRLLIIRRNGLILLTSSPRLGGFWELPETPRVPAASVKIQETVGSFRHSITSSQYCFEVVLATAKGTPAGCRWWNLEELENIPLSTASKKALRCLEEKGPKE